MNSDVSGTIIVVEIEYKSVVHLFRSMAWRVGAPTRKQEPTLTCSEEVHSVGPFAGFGPIDLSPKMFTAAILDSDTIEQGQTHIQLTGSWRPLPKEPKQPKLNAKDKSDKPKIYVTASIPEPAAKLQKLCRY